MGKVLDRLGDNGWIKRVDHATDRRAWQIVLSAKGRRAKEQMDEALKPLRARPAQVLGDAESKSLRNILARLADALDPAVWLFANQPERASIRLTRHSKIGR